MATQRADVAAASGYWREATPSFALLFSRVAAPDRTGQVGLRWRPPGARSIGRARATYNIH